MNINTSRTEIQNLLDLINSAERPIKNLEATHLSVGSVSTLVDDPNRFNTEIILSAVPGSGFSGQKTYRYNRYPLSASTVKNDHIYFSNYNSALAERAVEEVFSYASGSIVLDYSTLPPTVGTPRNVVANAGVDSLTYTGSLNFTFTYSDKKTIRLSEIPTYFKSSVAVSYTGAPYTGFIIDGAKPLADNVTDLINLIRSTEVPGVDPLLTADFVITSTQGNSYWDNETSENRYECTVRILGAGGESEYADDAYNFQTYTYRIPSFGELIGSPNTSVIDRDCYDGESFEDAMTRFCTEFNLPRDSFDVYPQTLPSLGQTAELRFTAAADGPLFYYSAYVNYTCVPAL